MWDWGVDGDSVTRMGWDGVATLSACHSFYRLRSDNSNTYLSASIQGQPG